MNRMLKALLLLAVVSVEAKFENCDQSANPLGECECEGQLFLNADCSEGFICTTQINDSILYDGCLKRCAEGETLLVDVERKEWDCVAESANATCPGAVDFTCEDKPVDTDPETVVCGCDWQVHINSECTEGIICHSSLPGGKTPLVCKENFEIKIDYKARSWICKNVTDESPSTCPVEMGGVIMGCHEDLPPPIGSPELECNFLATNPLGDCGGCPQQMFVGSNCGEAFYCTDASPDHVGCHLKCPEGEIVEFDLYSREWQCRTMPPNWQCPGDFNIDCPAAAGEDYKIECGCAGELWMSPDCTEVSVCNAASSGGAVDTVDTSCPNGQVVLVDLPNGKPFDKACADATSETVCPGSFHYGCNGGNGDGDGNGDGNGGAGAIGAAGFLVTLAAAIVEAIK